MKLARQNNNKDAATSLKIRRGLSLKVSIFPLFSFIEQVVSLNGNSEKETVSSIFEAVYCVTAKVQGLNNIMN